MLLSEAKRFRETGRHLRFKDVYLELYQKVIQSQ